MARRFAHEKQHGGATGEEQGGRHGAGGQHVLHALVPDQVNEDRQADNHAQQAGYGEAQGDFVAGGADGHGVSSYGVAFQTS